MITLPIPPQSSYGIKDNNYTESRPHTIEPPLITRCQEYQENQLIVEPATKTGDLLCKNCKTTPLKPHYYLKSESLEMTSRVVTKKKKKRCVKPLSDKRLIQNFLAIPRSSASSVSEVWDSAPEIYTKNTGLRPEISANNPKIKPKTWSENIAGSIVAAGAAVAVCGGLMLASLSAKEEQLSPNLADQTRNIANFGEHNPHTQKAQKNENFVQTCFTAFASADSGYEIAQYISNAQRHLEDIIEWQSKSTGKSSAKLQIPQVSAIEDSIEDGITVISLSNSIAYPTHIYLTNGKLD